MKPLIEKKLLEGLTIDENLHGDMYCFMDKYLKLLPNAIIDDEDIWTITDDMVKCFGESVDKMKERKKLNSKIKTN